MDEKWPENDSIGSAKTLLLEPVCFQGCFFFKLVLEVSGVVRKLPHVLKSLNSTGITTIPAGPSRSFRVTPR
ncbi:hypothetical protein C1H46_033813 [Malus baccata]|uniref:Uncharacterized protein n=1 Tax=Malus baccata TaxID=106549 RepID=A0A540L2C4_MALBA|nr:hypothetical protein C1H46_033813 [Malus baccata]